MSSLGLAFAQRACCLAPEDIFAPRRVGTNDQRNPFPRCCLQPWLYPSVWDLAWLSCDPRAQDRKVSEGMEELGVRMGSYIHGHHRLQRVSGEGLVAPLS